MIMVCRSSSDGWSAGVAQKDVSSGGKSIVKTDSLGMAAAIATRLYCASISAPASSFSAVASRFAAGEAPQDRSSRRCERREGSRCQFIVGQLTQTPWPFVCCDNQPALVPSQHFRLAIVLRCGPFPKLRCEEAQVQVRLLITSFRSPCDRTHERNRRAARRPQKHTSVR